MEEKHQGSCIDQCDFARGRVTTAGISPDLFELLIGRRTFWRELLKGQGDLWREKAKNVIPLPKNWTAFR